MEPKHESTLLMTPAEALTAIRDAINASPRNAYTAELHVQVIKHAEVLKDVTAKEFCEALGIAPSFGTEFLKMRKIAGRLVGAGLDVSRI